MAENIRDILAVVVAAGSPVGQLAEAINDLTAHLPTPEEPDVCPMCWRKFWPCAGFDRAAHIVLTAQLRVGDLVPFELHSRLWPQHSPPP